MDLSPGLDFETRLFAKTNAAAVLREELAKPGYRPEWIALGANTDAWQPVERQYGITRQILQVLAECRHPVGIVTKSALIERDIDLLQQLAAVQAVQVMISLDTLDGELARRMDPRAASPARRLQTLAALAAAGIPTGVLVAPVIPWLTDHEMEATLDAARAAGANIASYSLLRLPLELKDLFNDWLATHYPDKQAHVLKLLTELHGGELYRSGFGTRMCGQGPYADILRQRFSHARRRLGYLARMPELSTAAFRPPSLSGQGDLFVGL